MERSLKVQYGSGGRSAVFRWRGFRRPVAPTMVSLTWQGLSHAAFIAGEIGEALSCRALVCLSHCIILHCIVTHYH